MSKKILDKRNSLERFIREQTLGPGINGYRYVDLEDESLVTKNLRNESAIDYSAEILDIVPAAIYSTGILFPEDASGSCIEGLVLDNNDQIEKKDDADDADFQNNSEDDFDNTDTVELNQIFPRTMGLTCCFDEKYLDEETIEFKVKLRYYKKLKQDKEGKFNEKIGLLCEVNNYDFSDFLNQNHLLDFSLRVINQNTFVLLTKLKQEEITSLKTRLKEIQKQHSERLFDKMCGIITIPKLTKASCYLSNLKSSLYYELKNDITDEEIRFKIYEITQEIELIESITDHLRNLLDVNSGGYGLWQSELVERTVRIEDFSFPKSQKKKLILYGRNSEKITIFHTDGTETKGLRDLFRFDLDEQAKDYASISANVQLSRDSRKVNNKIFLKIQLVNTSTAFIKSNEDSRYYSTFNELVNQKAFFGVNISVTNKFIVSYSDYEYTLKNNEFNEDTTTQFIYDQFKDYAVGHGCSVKWDIKEFKRTVETEYLPSCETPDIDPVPRNKNSTPVFNKKDNFFEPPFFLENTKSQEFKWLSVFSDADDTEILKGLIGFVDSYGNWILTKREEGKYKDKYAEIAKQELDKCESDYLRMKTNIRNFLSGNKNRDNLLSFRLMNGAMFMQLWHSIEVKNGTIANYFDEETFSTFDLKFYEKSADDKLFSKTESATWRAFQLAFIILNLDGIFKEEHDTIWDKRNNWVDLVWFPTGGGKTEAYLGLIALTIINRRRIFRERGGGTAAIMRYTLRLLTMQQFQRATLVIMALELIRRWDKYDLGEEPINIGLWVGNDSLPNKLMHKYTDRNKDSLLNEFQKLNEGRENKIPLNNCPWCGSKIIGETEIDKTNLVFQQNRLHLKCSNTAKCSFSFGTGRSSHKKSYQGPIPVCLSDEIIYQHPPALLFGTVDKFAQLAHKVSGTDNGRKADSRRIFGRGNWEIGKPNKGYLPPDLIIQDELHLLLGPLGSAVALFESAVNQLCTREDGTRPKIISSTATTRNTQLQIMALFDRNVNLFPKPGVECDDSFFAFYRRKYSDNLQKDEEYLSNRKYIGVLPTGRTQIWMQMRLSAIIMTHRAIFELQELDDNSPINFKKYNDFEKAMDYYHTTISYFNSLKEVGKTQSQVQSYILKELRRVFSRVIRPQKLIHSLYTYGPIKEAELTGRLSGEDVKNELRNVETKWKSELRFANLQNNETIKGTIPPEFVVATNMISVGIDVSRFNTIIMNSMPRNTAEYIQASSRVARNSYGLVLTVHHPFRARDISHYEKFIEFHEKMYSYVEPISITPFTQKAVERYMGLYVATMIRHTQPQFVERNSADIISRIGEVELQHIIADITHYFDERKLRISQPNFGRVVANLLKEENIHQIKKWVIEAFDDWINLKDNLGSTTDLVFNNKKNLPSQQRKQEQLYVDIEEYETNIHSKKWQVPMSLRVIAPESAIKINSL